MKYKKLTQNHAALILNLSLQSIIFDTLDGPSYKERQVSHITF